jgi:hypothetical protein
MIFELDFSKAFEIAKENKIDNKNLIKVNENKILVSLTDKGGYEQAFFTNYEVNAYPDGEKYIFTINKKDESSEIIFQKRSIDEILKIIESAKLNSIEKRKCNCGENCMIYAKYLEEASESNEIPDPILLLSLMMQESSCVYSESDSSFGLMQIGAAGYTYCKSLGSFDEIKKDHEKNIQCGAINLRKNFETHGEKGVTFQGCSSRNINYLGWEAALRAYNGLRCNKDYPAQDYFVEEIIARYNKLNEAVV